MTMQVHLKCYATLAKYQPPNSENTPIQEGKTVMDLIEELKIDAKDVKVCFLNGRSVPFETQLHDGDRVALFPAVGGG
jgi:sulfur carrier protein ThiS